MFLIFALLVGFAFSFYQRHYGNQNIPRVGRDYIDEFHRRSDEIAASVSARSNDSSAAHNASSQHDELSTHSGQTSKPVFDPHTPNTKLGSASTNYNKNKFLININTASEEELQRIPRIGPVTAQRIINFREQNGNFRSVDQLVEVKGIGPTTLSRIKHYMTID